MIPNNIQQKITDINEAITSKIINTEKEVLAEIRDAFGINKITIKIEWDDEEDIIDRRPSAIWVRAKDRDGNVIRMENTPQSFDYPSEQESSFMPLIEDNNWEYSCYIEGNDYIWDITTAPDCYSREIRTNDNNETIIKYSISTPIDIEEASILFEFDYEYADNPIQMEEEETIEVTGHCYINGYSVKNYPITMRGCNHNYENVFEIKYDEEILTDSNGRFSFTIDSSTYLFGVLNINGIEVSTENIVVTYTEETNRCLYLLFPKGEADLWTDSYSTRLDTVYFEGERKIHLSVLNSMFSETNTDITNYVWAVSWPCSDKSYDDAYNFDFDYDYYYSLSNADPSSLTIIEKQTRIKWDYFYYENKINSAVFRFDLNTTEEEINNFKQNYYNESYLDSFYE